MVPGATHNLYKPFLNQISLICNYCYNLYGFIRKQLVLKISRNRIPQPAYASRIFHLPNLPLAIVSAFHYHAFHRTICSVNPVSHRIQAVCPYSDIIFLSCFQSCDRLCLCRFPDFFCLCRHEALF